MLVRKVDSYKIINTQASIILFALKIKIAHTRTWGNELYVNKLNRYTVLYRYSYFSTPLHMFWVETYFRNNFDSKKMNSTRMIISDWMISTHVSSIDKFCTGTLYKVLKARMNLEKIIQHTELGAESLFVAKFATVTTSTMLTMFP